MSEPGFTFTSSTIYGPPYVSIRGKPCIVVSSKGLVNKLSDIPNDGADFGPDTLLNATSPNQYGPPYTTTGGRSEAAAYAALNPTTLGVILTGSDATDVGIGTGALANNSGDNGNTAIGNNAGYSNTTGSYNTFTGLQAGYSNTTGSYNTFTGQSAGYSNTTGFQNTFTGMNAGSSNTTGRYNTFTGQGAGQHNTTGNYNTFTGLQAGYSNTIGSENTFTGYEAGSSNTTGSENTFTGYQAGYNFNDTTGSSDYLVLIGYQAGYNYTGSERNNIVIGYVEGTEGESGVLRIGSNNTTYIFANMTSMKGLGYSPVYAGALLTALGTTSATIASYTPTSSTGQQFTVKWVISAAAAATPTLTLTFTDPKAGAQTITLYNTAMSKDTVASGTYTIVADSSAAIIVSGDSSAATSLYASVTIMQEQ